MAKVHLQLFSVLLLFPNHCVSFRGGKGQKHDQTLNHTKSKGTVHNIIYLLFSISTETWYKDTTLALLTSGKLKVDCPDSLSTGSFKEMTLGLLHFTRTCFSLGLHASCRHSHCTSASTVIQPQQNLSVQISKIKKKKFHGRIHGPLFSQQPVYFREAPWKKSHAFFHALLFPVLQWRVTLGCGGWFCCTPDKAIRVPPDGY